MWSSSPPDPLPPAAVGLAANVSFTKPTLLVGGDRPKAGRQVFAYGALRLLSANDGTDLALRISLPRGGIERRQPTGQQSRGTLDVSGHRPLDLLRRAGAVQILPQGVEMHVPEP